MIKSLMSDIKNWRAKDDMPIVGYLVFVYFMGVFSSFPKDAWYDYLWPLMPFATIFFLKWLWHLKPAQRTLTDYSDET